MAKGFKTVPAVVVDMGGRNESKITPEQYDKLRNISSCRVKNSNGYDGIYHQITNGQIGFSSQVAFPSIPERGLVFAAYDQLDYTFGEGTADLNSAGFMYVKPEFVSHKMTHAIIGFSEI